ncbi:hypothetical protein AB0D12_33865 [Streptomyces sp. NPDC048479]|uniref:hypothetical protein n=1 Tax=Streptomyces sp. NPDC048479 TaxID=3154725 RepID=UPI003423D079
MGFDCTLERAHANLENAAERYPQFLMRVEGKRWSWEVPDNVGIHTPAGAFEQIEDNRAFTTFAHDHLAEVAARPGEMSENERRLLGGVKRILDDYEMRHESAVLSHTPNEDTGLVEGMRWSLESLLWARFSGPPSEYPAEWRP